MWLHSLLSKISRAKDYTLDEVHAIYVTHVIYGLAQSLLGIFIPIYIYNLSKEQLVLSENLVTNGFLWVILFFAVCSLVVVLSILIFGRLIFEWTLKKTIFFSQLFLIACYAFLSLAEHNLAFILIAAAFCGVHNTFYWIPYHIFFVKRADDGDKKYGAEIGKRDLLVSLSSTLGPLLGALMIAHLGFSVLYGFAIFLLLISTLPIIIFVREGEHRTHTFSDVYSNFIKNRAYIKTSLALGGSTISGTISAIFWTLMLYFGIKSFVEIGFLITSSSVLAMILLVIVGKAIDTKGKKVIHSLGVAVGSLLQISRVFFNSLGFLYANVILDNANSPSYNVPFNASIYEKSLEGSVSDFLIYREIMLHGIRLIVLVLVGVVLYLTNSWTWTFFVGAIGSILTILVDF
ncbi:MAG: MFS transporter [Patescibacteria group bacterium]|jgi:hypothetical protein